MRRKLSLWAGIVAVAGAGCGGPADNSHRQSPADQPLQVNMKSEPLKSNTTAVPGVQKK